MTGPTQPGTRRLTPNGKPMRALGILSAAERPLSEVEVWIENGRGTTTWHDPLATLVKRGYATRYGTRGRHRYEITEAGRKAYRP